jgi:hypothetical protein
MADNSEHQSVVHSDCWKVVKMADESVSKMGKLMELLMEKSLAV